jgi:hypothetical protein
MPIIPFLAAGGALIAGLGVTVMIFINYWNCVVDFLDLDVDRLPEQQYALN